MKDQIKYYRNKFKDPRDFIDHIHILNFEYMKSVDIDHTRNKELKKIHRTFGTIEIRNLINIIYK